MKFANYLLNIHGTNYIGDYIQIIAIDELYKRMGIPEAEIIYLTFDQLQVYKGEYVVLPVAVPLMNYYEDGYAEMFSDHVIPVFLGLTMIKDILSEKEVQYFQRFEPVGCRDERTLQIMRQYGINAYLNGCISLILQRKITGHKHKRVYIVDVPENKCSLIPECYRNDAVYLSHHAVNKDNKALAKSILRNYEEGAALVITPLLHCALPCVAYGIPVVLFMDEVSYRFSWIDKLIPIYTSATIGEIKDGVPQLTASDTVMIKEQIFENAKKQLMMAKKKYEDIYTISWFWENRKKGTYHIDMCDQIFRWIDQHWIDYQDSYTYSFWGMTQVAETVYQYIINHYPNATLYHIYDDYRVLRFQGVTSVAHDLMTNDPDEYLFVTAYGAVSAAKEYTHSIHKDSTYISYCYETTDE